MLFCIFTSEINNVFENMFLLYIYFSIEMRKMLNLLMSISSYMTSPEQLIQVSLKAHDLWTCFLNITCFKNKIITLR